MLAEEIPAHHAPPWRLGMRVTKRAVIYSRISIASEESVSVARQIQSAGQYAKALGWR